MTFRLNAEEYTFPSVHGPFSRIDHNLGHKSNLSKFKKIEISSSIFSSHNVIRLEINHKGKTAKKHKNMEAQQYTTKQPIDHWRNQRGNQNIPRNKWKPEHSDPKPMGYRKLF